MNECTDGVGSDNSQQPSDQENDGYGVQHRDLSLFTYEFVSRQDTGRKRSPCPTPHSMRQTPVNVCAVVHTASHRWTIWRSRYSRPGNQQDDSVENPSSSP